MLSNELEWSVRGRMLVLALSSLAACGPSEIPSGPDKDEHDTDMSPSKGEEDDGTDGPVDAHVPADECQTFDSSFAAIQTLVFERHGCSAVACHGSKGKAGKLDLSAAVAWDNVVNAASSNSRDKRVLPGSADDSFLYQKLLAATKPGSVQVAGSPMPLGGALSEDELAAVKIWIDEGAPKTGTVSDPETGKDIASLLEACESDTDAGPVVIGPLEPPDPEEGFQLRLPSFVLKAGTETEHCTPFAFDLTNQIPAEYKDVARNVVYTNGTDVQSTSNSHHMVVWNPKLDLTSVAENAPGWTCQGGSQEGKACNPRKGSADCGDGACAGESVPGTFCNGDSSALITGVGTPTLEGLLALLEILAQTGGAVPDTALSAQTPRLVTPPLDGVYTEFPLRGIFWFNSHSFNLTEKDILMEARANLMFAKKREREMRLITNSKNVYIAAGTPPFTRKTFCAKHVVPQHYQIATLASHNHRRGEHFWVKDPSGKQIYESFDYSDPLYLRFDPWMSFDSADEASRTLEYCATFNNGLTKDDKPDLNLVTRKSRMPAQRTCTPVACVTGKVTAACTTDRDCDSAAGKNDGACDACAITAGQTTEDEMFALMPWYVMPPKP